mmetsp:Transcript_18639/g.46138  ORF Transcript_18639/g.46138 Transcript_18639/m.46138 type:complete len:157 (+) Transcript_18639:44-514(+)
MSRILILTILSICLSDAAFAFSASTPESSLKTWLQSPEDESSEPPTIETVAEASLLLAEWDRFFNPEAAGGNSNEVASKLKDYIPAAVRVLSETAAEQRAQDSTQGRCMLGTFITILYILVGWIMNMQVFSSLTHTSLSLPFQVSVRLQCRMRWEL